MLPAATGAPLPWWFPASAAFWRHGDVYGDAGRRTDGKTLSPTLAPWARAALPAPLRRWLPGSGAAYERVQGSGDGGDPGFGGAEVSGEAGAGGDGRHGEGRDAGEDARDIEEQAAAPVAARLSGLWKVYGKKVAVRDLSLELHQGEILALLGHNGAGKTSAMGMLTGLIRPSAGACAVMGHSLAMQPRAARFHLGYCPQSNVLFDALTPREHLVRTCAPDMHGRCLADPSSGLGSCWLSTQLELCPGCRPVHFRRRKLMMQRAAGYARPASLSKQMHCMTSRHVAQAIRRNLQCPLLHYLRALRTVTRVLAAACAQVLFAAVKGITNGAARAEAAASMLAAVGLEEKAECGAGTLSGGSKRKLQVGIALLAGSRVVLLDEPSSGAPSPRTHSTLIGEHAFGCQAHSQGYCWQDPRVFCTSHTSEHSHRSPVQPDQVLS